MLPGVAFEPFFSRGVIEQAVSFDYVQTFRMRRAVPVDHRIWPNLQAHGIDDQRFAFIMADRISVPGRFYLRRMLLVDADFTNLVVIAVQNCDLARLLHQLRWAIGKDEGWSFGPALIAGIRISDSIQPEFAMLSHDLRRLGFQNRIGVITGKPENIAGAVRPARPIHQRGGTGWQRFEARIRVDPEAGKSAPQFIPPWIYSAARLFCLRPLKIVEIQFIYIRDDFSVRARGSRQSRCRNKFRRLVIRMPIEIAFDQLQ